MTVVFVYSRGLTFLVVFEALGTGLASNEPHSLIAGVKLDEKRSTSDCDGMCDGREQRWELGSRRAALSLGSRFWGFEWRWRFD